MITKQPTIEDIYNFDAFITTPGVRDGLLERANSGDPELTTHDTDDGPVVYYNAPHGEEIAVGRPIQLAEVGATKMGDYGYSGERQATMTDYDPTVRERLAEFLQAGFERFGMDRYKARQNAQTLMGGPSSNLPLQTGIADIVPFLGTALQTQEAARLGGESVESAKRGEYGTAAVQAGFAGLGMIPGAVGTVQAGKALAPTAGKMAMDVAEKTGMPVRGLGIVEDTSYRGSHSAPNREFGAPLNDLTGDGGIYPSDVYSAKGAHMYGDGWPFDRKAFDIASQFKDKPNAMVTIYRAVPREIPNSEKLAEIEGQMAAYLKRNKLPDDAFTTDGSKWYDWAAGERDRLRELPDEPAKEINTINPGDWVTITRDYAKEHGQSVLNGKYKIITKKVKASDIYTNGDSIHEWGYDPAAKEQK